MAVVLSDAKPEYAVLLRCAAVVTVSCFVFKMFFEKIKSFLSILSELTNANELISLIVKAAVICIITKIVFEICKDSGNLAVAQAIEMAGRVIIVIMSLPLMESVIKTAIAFIE